MTTTILTKYDGHPTTPRSVSSGPQDDLPILPGQRPFSAGTKALLLQILFWRSAAERVQFSVDFNL